MKILIVDDNAIMRRLLKNLLNQLNFRNIDDASDGLVALEKLKKTTYSLVISDWNMPQMNGLQLLQSIKIDLKLCRIPFIMITIENSIERFNMVKNAGVDGYIVKPFSIDVLKHTIHKVLHIKE